MQNARSKVRWLKWVFVLAVFPAVLFVGGLIAVWYHYRTTPDFETYLASNPVDPEQLEQRTERGEELGGDRLWRIGDVDPRALDEEDARYDRAEIAVGVDVKHGADPLLDLRVVFAAALESETFERGGFSVEAERLETHDGVRALVVVAIDEAGSLVGPGSEARGRATVDVFLAAGSGPSTVRVVTEPDDRLERDDLLAAWGWPSRRVEPAGWLLLSLVPYGSPPEQGWVHHVRQGLGFSWRKHEDGYTGASIMNTQHEVSTLEYSFDLTVTVDAGGAGASLGRTWERSMSRVWNDEIW